MDAGGSGESLNVGLGDFRGQEEAFLEGAPGRTVMSQGLAWGEGNIFLLREIQRREFQIRVLGAND